MKKTYIIPEIEVMESELADAVMLALSSDTEADADLDVLSREADAEDGLWLFGTVQEEF